MSPVDLHFLLFNIKMRNISYLILYAYEWQNLESKEINPHLRKHALALSHTCMDVLAVWVFTGQGPTVQQILSNEQWLLSGGI